MLGGFATHVESGLIPGSADPAYGNPGGAGLSPESGRRTTILLGTLNGEHFLRTSSNDRVS
jgi:hypothetical protein